MRVAFAYGAISLKALGTSLNKPELTTVQLTSDGPQIGAAEPGAFPIRHLEGELPEAAAAYREAERLRSDLPGLERNMALLNEEQRKSDSTRSSSP